MKSSVNPPGQIKSDTLRPGDHWSLERPQPQQAPACLFIGLCLFVTLWAPPTRAADDWRQFRGPNGDGSSTAQHLPLHWSESNNITWKRSIPGRGRSSPVILGDRLWMTTAVEKGTQRKRIGSDDMQTTEHISLRAVCLDRADGKLLWETALFEIPNPDPVHWLNSWATPTPVVEPGRLYCDFGTYGTACVEAETGQVLWQQRLPLDHQVGPGSSPVLWRELLILVRDGRDAQYVTALDKHTGQAVWKTNRPPLKVDGTNMKKSFVTPHLIESGHRLQLISPGAQWVVSYEPSTGQELWRVRHGTGFSIGSCPVFGHGMAFFSTGCMKAQLLAVRVDGDGDVSSTHVVWRTLRQVPVMSSPVLVGDELYWVSDDGMLTCADSQSAAIHWQERLDGLHLASPLSAEGRIYIFAEDGRTTVVKAGKTFEKLAENRLEGPVVATPSFVDDTVFIRTDGFLYRIAEK